MPVHPHPGIGYPYAPSVPFRPAQPWPGPPPIAPDAATVAAPTQPPFGGPPVPQPPRPGPYYPPRGWAPAPYPPPARRLARTWAIVGAATAAVLALGATGVALATDDASHAPTAGSTTGATQPATTAPPPFTPTTTPPAPVVPVSALPQMLAEPATVAAAVGSPAMIVLPDAHPDAMWNGHVDNPNCLGVYHPAELPVYQGSGWTAVQGQVLREPGDRPHNTVIQAVVSFPTAQAATDFTSEQRRSWARCVGRSITATYKDGSETFSVGNVNTDSGVLKARLIQQDSSGWSCQRALNTRNNVVIDVAVCSFVPGDQAVAIATEIAGRGT
jgi:serine/threonine kinase PknH